MAVTERRTKVVGNPGGFFGRRARPKKSSSKYAGRRVRRNPIGQILGYTLANPASRKGSMAKTKKRYRPKKSYSSSRRGSRRKSHGNPVRRFGSHSHHQRRRHRRTYGNPKMMYRRRRRFGNPVGIGNIADYAINAGFVLIGGLGSKLGAQAILGANNVGVVGYAGNAVVGGVLWFLTRMFMKNKSAEAGIISGTILQIMLRVINDYTPFGTYVSQLGMGDYQMQSFVTPQILVDPWNSAEVAIPPGWAPALPAPTTTTPANMSGGRIPNGTPMTAMAPSGGGSGSGMSGLYGAGGGWGGGLY
jgi:hypothetical protein